MTWINYLMIFVSILLLVSCSGRKSNGSSASDSDIVTISTISPTVGPMSGGTSITIGGTGFRASASVTVGSNPCTTVNVESPTSLTCTTGASASPGSVNVTVANPDASPTTNQNAFIYYAGLSISATSDVIAINNSMTFAGSGGIAPYSYSVASGLGTIGVSSGIYTSPSSSTTATIEVTDSVGQSASSTVTVCGFDGTPTNIDDTTNSSGSEVWGSTLDGLGNYFTVGNSWNGSSRSWIVRKSGDNGASWQTVDTFQLETGFDSVAKGVGVAPNGDLYVAGYGYTSSSGVHWIVRKSSNHGAAWLTSDTYQHSGNSGSAKGIAVSGAGTILVAGDSGSPARWIVRKSVDFGNTWTIADDFQLSSGQIAMAFTIAVDQDDRIFVGGNSSNGVNTYATIRKSTDSGASWTTVESASPGRIASITSSSSGLFASGYSLANWVTFKSTNQGSSWTNVDSFSGVNNAAAFAVIVSSLNVVWVAGYEADANPPRMVLRRSTNLGSSWSTSMSYQYESNNYARGYTLVEGTNKEVLISGPSESGSGSVGHWVTRRINCQ